MLDRCEFCFKQVFVHFTIRRACEVLDSLLFEVALLVYLPVKLTIANDSGLLVRIAIEC